MPQVFEPLITAAEAASYLGLAVGTLKHRRATRLNCPPYWKTNEGSKAGVRYLLSELVLWREGKWKGPICRVMGKGTAA